MNKYFKESVLWALIALPYVYLATTWNKMPDVVPIHFDMEGNANGWANKTTFLFIPGALGIGIYVLMILLPFLDPKKKIEQMGEKYFSVRFMLTLFISTLSIYTIYAGNTGTLKGTNLLFALIGILFAFMGNYFQAIRPNYFIGIRTPWTLENEEVWKKTHRLGGRLWMAGGILIVILSFIIKSRPDILAFLFLPMGIVPIVFSYIEFRKEKTD